jgi:hypothetical protein
VDFAAGMFFTSWLAGLQKTMEKAERLLSVELLGAVSGGWMVFFLAVLLLIIAACYGIAQMPTQQ